MEFRSAGEVIYLYRDYQYLIVTRKKRPFLNKVFYKVCFTGCVALLPASYTEDNKISKQFSNIPIYENMNILILNVFLKKQFKKFIYFSLCWVIVSARTCL